MSILLALCSALVYGTSDYCGGRATRSAPVLVVTLAGQLVSARLIAIVVTAIGDPFPAGVDVAWAAAAGTMSMVGVVAFYYALANGAMTVVAPITAVVSAVVPVTVGIALGERPSGWALAGVVLALAAVALVSGMLGVADRPTHRSSRSARWSPGSGSDSCSCSSIARATRAGCGRCSSARWSC